MSERTTLAELVEAAAERYDGASGRALADIAQKAGYVLSHATLNRIRSGGYQSRPSDDTIKAIAWLAGVSERVAFAAADRPAPLVSFKDELPDGVDQLSPKRRRVALEMLRALIEAEQLDHTVDRLMTDPVLIETARKVLEGEANPPAGSGLARPTAEDIARLRDCGLIPPQS